jgi:uncharacterized protein YecT (DUF1311 family)
MNMTAGDHMQSLEAEMNTLLSAIEARGEISVDLLHGSQEAWDKFSRRQADLHASLVAGGSMYSMIWASARTKEIQHRIDALQWWLEREEGET